MNNKVKQEVLDAYADCHGNLDWDTASKIRNLDFIATEAVSRNEAKEILTAALDSDSYNEFFPSLLDRFPEDCKVYIAREGSVCLYVVGKNLPTAKKVLADERHLMKNFLNSVRYWWD